MFEVNDYNEDLCYVSTDESDDSLPDFRSVLEQFPKSQHRLILFTAGIQIPVIKSYWAEFKNISRGVRKTYIPSLLCWLVHF